MNSSIEGNSDDTNLSDKQSTSADCSNKKDNDSQPKQSDTNDSTAELENAFEKVQIDDNKKDKSCSNYGKSDKILEDGSVESVVKYIKSGKCKNIIFMVGAGISTSAGIPDFRSPKTGLFHQLEKYNLPYPEAVFDIDFFKNNPKPFFHLARELFPGNFKPTPCHYFMKLINDKNLLLRLYTQNIDSLERLAGVPADKLIEAHGTFNTGHCINKKCRKEYSLEWMKKIVLEKDKENNVPHCENCNSYVKPDIIFYGENLPNRFYKLIETDFKKCDLLIIMGTSLTVQPFASLVDFVGKKVPRLMINKTKPEGGGSSFLTRLFKGLNSGLDFNSKDNTRDVFMKSESDAGSYKIAEMLDWKEELDQLING